jgi:hypothetical protein
MSATIIPMPGVKVPGAGEQPPRPLSPSTRAVVQQLEAGDYHGYVLISVRHNADTNEDEYTLDTWEASFANIAYAIAFLQYRFSMCLETIEPPNFLETADDNPEPPPSAS